MVTVDTTSCLGARIFGTYDPIDILLGGINNEGKNIDISNADDRYVAKKSDFTFPITVKLFPKEIYINDNKVHTISGTPINGTYSIYMFCCNNSGSKQYPFAGKIYYLNVFDKNNIKINSLMPVRRIIDGVAGFYDKINDKFYQNAATNGNLYAGPDTGEIIM